MSSSMSRWVGKAAIVTGASAGIGYSIAKLLASAGVEVVAVARREDKLKMLQKEAQGKVYPYCADMTKEQDILNLFKWVKEHVGPIHILINNAGIATVSNLTEGSTKLWRDVLDVNVVGLCIATREAVSDMRANKVDGHIIQINSIAGHRFLNMPNFNIYIASKHAVTALTEGLRNELNSFGDKIKVTSVSPGYVATEFLEATMKSSGLESGKNELEETLKTAPFLKSEDVASAVVYILSTPPHVQIHELMIKPVGEEF